MSFLSTCARVTPCQPTSKWKGRDDTDDCEDREDEKGATRDNELAGVVGGRVGGERRGRVRVEDAEQWESGRMILYR